MNAGKWIGWTVTGLMAALMIVSAIPDVLQIPDAVAVFRHLGYPAYLLPFLGTAKMLAVGAVLFPGASRIKEWAFAGLTFDLAGALYSHLSVGDPPSAWLPAAIGLALMAGSYVSYRRRLNQAKARGDRPADADGTAVVGSRVELHT